MAARFCLVSAETFRRWRCDRTPNRTALRLLAIRAGYLPWPEWRGWELHGGCLFPPGISRGGFSPGDLLANPLWRQVVTSQAAELADLRARVALVHPHYFGASEGLTGAGGGPRTQQRRGPGSGGLSD